MEQREHIERAQGRVQEAAAALESRAVRDVMTSHKAQIAGQRGGVDVVDCRTAVELYRL